MGSSGVSPCNPLGDSRGNSIRTQAATGGEAERWQRPVEVEPQRLGYGEANHVPLSSDQQVLQPPQQQQSCYGDCGGGCGSAFGICDSRYGYGQQPQSGCVGEPPVDYRYADAHMQAEASPRAAADPSQLALMPVCPTPYVLGSVCGRGEREYPQWKFARDSNEILGNYAQMMGDTCRYIFDVVAGLQGQVKVLSAADGCSDDTQTDLQARYVPTSVMLMHAFAASVGNWQDQRTRVRVYGGDVRNAICPWWQQQQLPWLLPPWLEHRFVALDNTHDFTPQLFSNKQCEEDCFFDAVLLRQGLCFCDDPSKNSTHWPVEVEVSKAVVDASVCGIYVLEPHLLEGRPAYRREYCVLQWCPARGEWAVLDALGGAWAYARGDVGHPCLARGPWAIWDGAAHVNDTSFSVDLVQPGEPPWQRPPQHRICCCGIPGDTANVLRLIQRIVAILDTRQPHSFGLIHGAWTNGTRTEVHQLHVQIEDAVRAFNQMRGRGVHTAAVLRRTAAKEYWLQCDGIIIFQPGSRADPFCAYGCLPQPCDWQACPVPQIGDG